VFCFYIIKTEHKTEQAKKADIIFIPAYIFASTTPLSDAGFFC